jgi:undecaprenyl-diphosphatase
VLLGLLQGVTEFLPVSSTAHMDIAPQLFGMRDPGAAFSAVVQLGPIVAIIAYFRQDLARYASGFLRTINPGNLKPNDVDARLGWFTVLGTIPLCIFGLLFEKKIGTTFRSLNLVAAMLILLAIVLLVAEKVGSRRKPLERMTFPDSQVIGWAQVLALIPGTSRSGLTITAGLFRGLDRESAARFSFLLSIPAITLAGVYKLVKVLHQTHLGHEAGPYVLAAIVAGVFAYVVVRWFMGYMKEHNTGIFIAYRILLGIFVLVSVHQGWIHTPPKEEPAAKSPVTAASARVVRPAHNG